MDASVRQRHLEVAVREIDAPSPALARAVAHTVRAAYRLGDLLPGLPVPGGALETPADVVASGTRGVRLWVAYADGMLAGTVRAAPSATGDWLLQRLAVHPGFQRRDVGRALVDAVEAAVAGAGGRRLVAHAVVERGNPVFYARTGFEVVRHFGTPDRPVSEVVLARPVTAAWSASFSPFGKERRPVLPGAVVAWSLRRDGIWGRVVDGTDCALAAAGRALRQSRWQRSLLLGADVWPLAAAGSAAALRRLLRRDGVLWRNGEIRLRPDRVRARIATPRATDDRLVALWRTPASRRVALAHPHSHMGARLCRSQWV